MSRTNNFVKKYFLSTNWDNTNFHHFCKVRACRYSFKNSIFQKLRNIVEKHSSLMSGTNNFAKKYFLTTNWDNTNFHHFCKVQNSIFQKLPKIVEKHFFWWVECPKKLWRNTHHFCQVRACRYSFENSIFQKLPKIVEKHFLWWVEQIILPKNIFLAQIEIIQIFTIFVRSAPVDIPSKIQFSKNCLKLWRNTSFDEWNFCQKIFS